MRELRELVWRWLDRIPAQEKDWQPDPEAVQVERRQRDLERALAELNIYVDTMGPDRNDNYERTHRAI